MRVTAWRCLLAAYVYPRRHDAETAKRLCQADEVHRRRTTRRRRHAASPYWPYSSHHCATERRSPHIFLRVLPVRQVRLPGPTAQGLLRGRVRSRRPRMRPTCRRSKPTAPSCVTSTPAGQGWRSTGTETRRRPESTLPSAVQRPVLHRWVRRLFCTGRYSDRVSGGGDS
jgi:hypothetical protein